MNIGNPKLEELNQEKRELHARLQVIEDEMRYLSKDPRWSPPRGTHSLSSYHSIFRLNKEKVELAQKAGTAFKTEEAAAIAIPYLRAYNHLYQLSLYCNNLCAPDGSRWSVTFNPATITWCPSSKEAGMNCHTLFTSLNSANAAALIMNRDEWFPVNRGD